MALMQHAFTRAVFLDKDGTLIDDLPFNVDPAHITLAAGAGEALQLLRAAGFRLFVVSNQSGVAMGLFDEEALTAVAQKINALLAPYGVSLDGFYYCAHHPAGRLADYALSCDCRKPAPGMLLRAAQEHGLVLQSCWMVGDILDDVEAGRRATCNTVLIDNGNETEWKPGPLRTPHYKAANLLQAARQICQHATHSPVQ